MHVHSVGASHGIHSPSTQRSNPVAQSLEHSRIAMGPTVASMSSQSPPAA
jgi:hypothetical protein